MKLLSDFDGVWTHPFAEGRAQGEALERRLLAGVPGDRRAEARAWIARARAAIAAEPTRWGWACDGRISAFADEDPFAPHSALMHHLATRAREDDVAALLHDAITGHGESTLDRAGLEAHLEGVALVEAERGPGVLPAAAAAGRALMARGVEIVLVSNSPPEKLDRWFAHAGLPHRAHPERAHGALRVRGNAGKHLLGPAGGDALEVGGARVEVGRPHYEAILREEAPDAIVGDVFSLDLALPLALKRREPAWRGVRLFWLVRDYAPARMRRALAAAVAAGEVEPVEDGLGGVAAALGAAQPPAGGS
jgi:hypothetical protein